MSCSSVDMYQRLDEHLSVFYIFTADNFSSVEEIRHVHENRKFATAFVYKAIFLLPRQNDSTSVLPA
jgi:hypothetical protein